MLSRRTTFFSLIFSFSFGHCIEIKTSDYITFLCEYILVSCASFKFSMKIDGVQAISAATFILVNFSFVLFLGAFTVKKTFASAQLLLFATFQTYKHVYLHIESLSEWNWIVHIQIKCYNDEVCCVVCALTSSSSSFTDEC